MKKILKVLTVFVLLVAMTSSSVMASSYIDLTAPQTTKKITIVKTPLKQAKSTKSKTLITIPKGKSVTVKKTNRVWSWIKYGGKIGYVKTASLKYPNEIGTELTIQGMKIRFDRHVCQKSRIFYKNLLKSLPKVLVVNVSDVTILANAEQMVQAQKAQGYVSSNSWVEGFCVEPCKENDKCSIYLRDDKQYGSGIYTNTDNLYHEFGHALDMHRERMDRGSYIYAARFSSLPEFKAANSEWQDTLWRYGGTEQMAEAVAWYYTRNLQGKPKTKALIQKLIQKKGTKLWYNGNPWK